MLRRILVISDDSSIKEAIYKYLLDYSKIFMVVGYAYHAVDGLELLKELKPDIVLLKYNLPFWGTKHFIQKVRDMGFIVQYILIISQEQIDDLNIEEHKYLSGILYLDEVFSTRLLEILKKTDKDIENNRNSQSHINANLNNTKSSLKMNLFENNFDNNSLLIEIVNSISVNRLEHILSTKYVNSNQKGMWMAIAEPVQNYGGDFSFYLHLELLQNYFRRLKQIIYRYGESEIFVAHEHKLYLFINPRSGLFNETAQSDLGTIIDELDMVALEFNLPLLNFSICGKPVKIQDIPATFNHLNKLSRHRFFLGNVRIMSLKETVCKNEHSIETDVNYILQDISYAMREENQSLVLASINKLFSKLKQACSFSTYLYAWYCIMSEYILMLRKFEIDEFKFIYFKHDDFTNIDQTKDAIISLFNNLFQEVIKRRLYNNPIIYSVFNFITIHLHEEDIGLKEIAKSVHLSPAYLSRIVSEKTGQPLIWHINRLRVEEAKNLIEVGIMKVYEVAFKVGYKNPKYFGQIFKKFTGLTPQQYKNKYCPKRI